MTASLSGDNRPAIATDLKPRHTPSSSRSLLIELVGNMVVFIICTLVCLQVFATSEAFARRSRAVALLGQDGISVAETFKSGCDLVELADRFGGQLDGDVMTLHYDSDFCLTGDTEQAAYRVVFTVHDESGSYTTAELQVYAQDEELLNWPVARFVTGQNQGYGD